MPTFNHHVLRAWRLDEARRQELPPYVIFHDATLIEVARRQPTSLDALADIPGIGRSKLDRYGDAILAIIAAKAVAGLPAAQRETAEDATP